MLQEATAEAAKRGHEHVGSEHLLFVLATTPRSFGRNILEHLGVAEVIVSGIDELLSEENYGKSGTNQVLGKDGELIGHLVVGADGTPRMAPLPEP